MYLAGRIYPRCESSNAVVEPGGLRFIRFSDIPDIEIGYWSSVKEEKQRN